MVAHLITCLMDVCTLWPAFFLLRIPFSYLAQRAIFTPTPEMVTHWQDDTWNVCQIIMRVVPLPSVLVPSLTVPEGVCLMCPFPTQRHIRQKEGICFNAVTLYNVANVCSKKQMCACAFVEFVVGFLRFFFLSFLLNPFLLNPLL